MLRQRYLVARGRIAHRGRIGRGAPRRGGLVAPGDLLQGIARRLVALAALAAVLAALWVAIPPVLGLAGDTVRGAAAAVKDAVTPDPIEMPQPVAGTRKLDRPLFSLVAVDDSGSTGDSDPKDLRHQAVRALGTWMGRYARPEDRAAVVRFAEAATSSGVVDPEALAAGAPALAEDPQDGRLTNVGPVVDEAEPLLRGASGAERLVIVVTDGEVPDAEASLARLKRLADRIVVVALDRGDQWDANASSWKQPGITIHEIDNRPMEIAALLASTILEMTGEKTR